MNTPYLEGEGNVQVNFDSGEINDHYNSGEQNGPTCSFYLPLRGCGICTDSSQIYYEYIRNRKSTCMHVLECGW